eukprot:1159349-Pelagomonas_calceolata.AAC.2
MQPQLLNHRCKYQLTCSTLSLQQTLVMTAPLSQPSNIVEGVAAWASGQDLILPSEHLLVHDVCAFLDCNDLKVPDMLRESNFLARPGLETVVDQQCSKI